MPWRTADLVAQVSNAERTTRRIGPIGTVARLVVGVGFLVVAVVVVGVGLLDVLLGLVAANVAVVAVLASRGRAAALLRATGPAGTASTAR